MGQSPSGQWTNSWHLFKSSWVAFRFKLADNGSWGAASMREPFSISPFLQLCSDTGCWKSTCQRSLRLWTDVAFVATHEALWQDKMQAYRCLCCLSCYKCPKWLWDITYKCFFHFITVNVYMVMVHQLNVPSKSDGATYLWCGISSYSHK